MNRRGLPAALTGRRKRRFSGRSPPGRTSKSSRIRKELENPEVTVEAYRETTNHVRFRARTPKPAIVIASLTNDGGWSGTDQTGRSLAVLAANGPFLGVPLEPGENLVELTYRPPGFRGGIVLTALSAISLAVVGGWRIGRRVFRARRKHGLS